MTIALRKHKAWYQSNKYSGGRTGGARQYHSPSVCYPLHGGAFTTWNDQSVQTLLTLSQVGDSAVESGPRTAWEA